MALISTPVRRLVAGARVGHLATAGHDQLGLVPVCFVLVGDTIYHAIDAKPKRDPRTLARLMNIRTNPTAAFLVDHYEEDWRRLWYVLVRGRARMLEAPDPEHRRAIMALRRKYRQYRSELPLDADAIVIAIDATTLRDWQASSAGRRRSSRRGSPG
ncbi:MAG TPA: TIGR03668 family PPOX class F420-dependent oxidoreductase [Candidatus Dormibacteraeota bacterium]